MIPEQIQFTTFGHQKYGEWVRLGPCLRRGSRRPCCSQQNLSNERLRNTRQNTSSTQGGWCQTRAQPKDTQTIIQPSRSSQKQLPHQDKDRNPTSPPVAKQENHLATGPQGAREQAPNETFPRRGYLTSRKRDFSKRKGSQRAGQKRNKSTNFALRKSEAHGVRNGFHNTTKQKRRRTVSANGRQKRQISPAGKSDGHKTTNFHADPSGGKNHFSWTSYFPAGEI